MSDVTFYEVDESTPSIVARFDAARKGLTAPGGGSTPLTAREALLLATAGRYLERASLQEVREGISERELQTVGYLLQRLGSPLQLTFTRGLHGPYSADLAHVLDALEGHYYLVRIGDRSGPVTDLETVKTLPDAIDQAEDVVARSAGAEERIRAFLRLVDGFETPYSLELLGTVDYAAQQPPPSADPAELARRVAAWNLRKARLFTSRHVEVAADRLAERHLLPT